MFIIYTPRPGRPSLVFGEVTGGVKAKRGLERNKGNDGGQGIWANST